MREAVAPDGTVLLASGVNNAVPAATVPNAELFYPAPLPAGIVVTTPVFLPNALENQPYTQVLLEHGGVGQVTWLTQSLPAGLSLSSSGVLTGTPTQVGAFSIPVVVIDSSTPPQSTTVSFALQVNGPLTITTTTLPDGRTNGGAPALSYSAQILTASGTGGTLGFSVVSGALPSTINLNSTSGALSSKAVTDPVGTYNFTIRAVSAGPPTSTATQAFTLKINSFFTPTTPNTLPAGTEGVAYATNITATGGVTPYTFQYSAFQGSQIPPGLSVTTLNATTAQVTGTPTAAGTYSFDVLDSDSSAPPQGGSIFFTVTIRPQSPTNLIASPQGTGLVTLTWTPSASGDIAGYTVRRGTTSGVYTTVINAGAGPQYVDTGLTSGQQYFYVVSAVSTSGVESVVSNEATVTAP